MEEYGKVKKIKTKGDRYGYQQQRAMICLSNDEEAAIAIKKNNNKKINKQTNIKGGQQRYKKTFHRVKCTQRTTAKITISKNIKNINQVKKQR